jgi:hypothetical protein
MGKVTCFADIRLFLSVDLSYLFSQKFAHSTNVHSKAQQAFAIYDQGRCDKAAHKVFEFFRVLRIQCH